MNNKQTHLGDGVYASFDGFMIRLGTDMQIPKHEIYLEPQVFASLLEFAGRHFNKAEMIKMLQEMQNRESKHLDDLPE